jgi:hypothetical protein
MSAIDRSYRIADELVRQWQGTREVVLTVAVSYCGTQYPAGTRLRVRTLANAGFNGIILTGRVLATGDVICTSAGNVRVR